MSLSLNFFSRSVLGALGARINSKNMLVLAIVALLNRLLYKVLIDIQPLLDVELQLFDGADI